MLNKELIESLYWDKKYTVEEIADYFNISFWSLYNIMRKCNIVRRDRSEAGYNFYKIKPQFELKSNLSIADEKLKIAGIMLYWAEGTFRGSAVDFVNSNPEMIQIFLKFLRTICGVSNDRLRVYLYAYPYQNLEVIKRYWSKITGIPLSQFTKPYVKRGNYNLSYRKLPFGLIHIRYNDKKLLELIKDWIKEYKDCSLRWAGTQVAKGDRLSKGSAPPKGGVEK